MLSISSSGISAAELSLSEALTLLLPSLSLAFVVSEFETLFSSSVTGNAFYKHNNNFTSVTLH